MNETAGDGPGDGLSFLLVQLGFHAARLFAERVAPLGIEPRHVGMLTRLAANEGRSQQAIGELLRLSPTQMVFLVDELEQRGLVERRRNPADRRSYALYLTRGGRDLLAQVGEVTRQHEDRIAASLSRAERGQLAALLRKVARSEGLGPDTLPGPPPQASRGRSGAAVRSRQAPRQTPAP